MAIAGKTFNVRGRRYSHETLAAVLRFCRIPEDLSPDEPATFERLYGILSVEQRERLFNAVAIVMRRHLLARRGLVGMVDGSLRRRSATGSMVGGVRAKG